MPDMPAELVLKRYTQTGVEERASPSVDDVNAALLSLDGLTSTELVIADVDTAGIFVVGGPDRFVCWVQSWSEDRVLAIAEATDPTVAEGVLAVKLKNGQVDEYSLSATIDRAAVGRAVQTYVETRELDPSVTWSLGPGWR